MLSAAKSKKSKYQVEEGLGEEPIAALRHAAFYRLCLWGQCLC